MGFDAVTIETKRAGGISSGSESKSRKKTGEYADSLGIGLAAAETMYNFASPVIEERENNTLIVKECRKFANDLGVPIVKIFTAWKETMKIVGLGWYCEGATTIQVQRVCNNGTGALRQ